MRCFSFLLTYYTTHRYNSDYGKKLSIRDAHSRRTDVSSDVKKGSPRLVTDAIVCDFKLDSSVTIPFISRLIFLNRITKDMTQK